MSAASLYRTYRPKVMTARRIRAVAAKVKDAAQLDVMLGNLPVSQREVMRKALRPYLRFEA